MPILSMRVTEAEMAELDARAASRGLKRAQYARQTLFPPVQPTIKAVRGRKAADQSPTQPSKLPPYSETWRRGL
jgi:hypothetical protein